MITDLSSWNMLMSQFNVDALHHLFTNMTESCFYGIKSQYLMKSLLREHDWKLFLRY